MKFLHHYRVLISTIILLLIPSTVLFSYAVSHLLRIPQLREDINYIRYQVNDQLFDGWTIIPAENPVFQLDHYDLEDDTLYVQQSIDGIIWSKSAKVRYDLGEGRWVLVLEEQTLEPESDQRSLNVWVSCIKPQGRYANYYKTALGFGAQVNNQLELVADLHRFFSIQYSYGFSETIWVEEFHEISFTGGLSSHTVLTSWMKLQTDIGAGAMVHVLNGDVYRKGNEGIFVFTDLHMHLTPRIVLQFDQHNTLSAAPRISLVAGQDALGFLFELQVGTQIRL